MALLIVEIVDKILEHLDLYDIKEFRKVCTKSPPSLKSAEEAIREEFDEIIQCPDSHQKLRTKDKEKRFARKEKKLACVSLRNEDV
ncbi:hypothetical protein TKK_0007063 [Trichogramma kaykai]